MRGGNRFLALILMLALVPASLGADSETLDGTFWKVRENGFQAKIFFWRYDHVAFRDGDFRSAGFGARGFSSGPYTASKSGESIAWTASLNSPDKGKIVWEGRRIGNSMEGTWTWRKADGGTKSTGWTAKQSHKDYVRKGSGNAPPPPANP